MENTTVADILGKDTFFNFRGACVCSESQINKWQPPSQISKKKKTKKVKKKSKKKKTEKKKTRKTKTKKMEKTRS